MYTKAQNTVKGLYADKALDSAVSAERPTKANALASLLLGAEQIKDDFLFAIGIKRMFSEHTFDLTNVSTLVQSAKSLGYDVQMMPNT